MMQQEILFFVDRKKSTIEYESVCFPFKWKYGRIIELLQDEKEEANRTRRYHNKFYKKPCALCGKEGVIEFRKKSNGSLLNICRECAEKYVRSASVIEKEITQMNKEAI